MPYRNSLRFRVFATFLGTGLLLGPLLATGFITLANELEEFAIERALAGRLGQVMATNDVTSPATPSGTPGWRVFGDISLPDLPLELAGKSGIYTIQSGKRPELDGPLPENQPA
ncbi:MAG: hypothetical protein R3E50_16545, partial [Halioglobus sp.]